MSDKPTTPDPALDLDKHCQRRLANLYLHLVEIHGPEELIALRDLVALVEVDAYIGSVK